MTDIILFLVIVALLSYIVVKEYFDKKERKLIMTHLMAKNLQEVIQAEAVEKIKPTVEEDPEFIPMESVTDDVFFKALKKTSEEEEDGQ